MKIQVLVVVLPLVLVLLIGYVPQAAAGASAVAQNDSGYVEATMSWYHVVGEVKNTGDVWLRWVKVTATLFDSGRGIVDVVFDLTETMYIPPDGVSPFDISEIDAAKSGRVASYTLVVEFQETQTVPVQSLAISNVADSIDPVMGWKEVVGQVTNQGPSVSQFTKIVATFYDANGKVAYVGFDIATPRDLQPSAIGTFKIQVIETSKVPQITRYSLIAESQSSGYTSVPEWPSPMLVAGIVLSLAAVVIRRKRWP